MDPAEQLGRQLDDAAPKRKPGGPVSRTFTLEEARALLPDVQDKAREFISLRADVTEVAAAMNAGARSSLGGMPEVKGWEARLHELIEWFVDKGLEPKGLAPLLLDFPSEIGGEPALLCWLEGESELAWWHRPEHGFGGRRPIALS
jgi:hypothetical protein